MSNRKSLVSYLTDYLDHELNEYGNEISVELLEDALDAFESTQGLKINVSKEKDDTCLLS